eukprot:TRINITY_DN1243_c0_g1_i1.p1 TRINITY_DN1243_c0_g1~~TRINITY_DN1243_c0_g1_i1.p1  ORF type:complete len:269 (+),score=43.64 TRINITY_DN1243_c0_g1_i1:95-901(+)
MKLWGLLGLGYLLMLCAQAQDYEERLPGWQGETHSVARSIAEKSQERRMWVEPLSWEPRASVLHNFLTDEECDHLIEAARPNMKRSTVVDSKTGQSVDSTVRTSSGTFLMRGQDEIVRAVEERIAKVTFIPVTHGEGFQILHYEHGQKYEPHTDWFDAASDVNEMHTRNGGQRLATMLLYLSDVEEGGETVFPAARDGVDVNRPGFDQLSECGRRGPSVKPKKGDALLFWSLTPEAKPDSRSLHGGCPVLKGSKWSATKWLRVHEYSV